MFILLFHHFNILIIGVKKVLFTDGVMGKYENIVTMLRKQSFRHLEAVFKPLVRVGVFDQREPAWAECRANKIISRKPEFNILGEFSLMAFFILLDVLT